MFDLPLIFVSGILGSAHCLGMCGPFAVILGSSTSTWSANVTRQLVYGVGRVFIYTTIGLMAGFAGWHVSESARAVVNIPALLSIAAGLFLLYQGLAAAGVLRVKATGGPQGPCLASGMLRSFLQAPTWVNVFLAGIFTGFLPCGLVYGFLGIAASTRSLVGGALTMAAFGLGTLPIMIAAGCGGQVLSLSARGRLFRVAAWCLAVAGAISIARGIGYLGFDAGATPDACPFCL